MPVAVGGQGEAALGAAQQGHVGVVGALEHGAARFDLLLEDGADFRPGCHKVAVVGKIGLKGEGGDDGHTGLHHGFQRRLVHIGGMQDEVKAGKCRIADAVGAPAMAHHGDVQGVGHVHHQFEFRPAPGLGLALPFLAGRQAGDVDLDPVHAELDLAAHFGGDLSRCPHHLAVADQAFVGYQPPGGAAGGGEQGVAAGGHARPGDNARLDGVAQVHADFKEAVGVQKARDPGAQQLAHVGGGDDGGEALPAMKEQLIVGTRLIEADVAVGVDQPRHEGEALGIDALALALRRRAADLDDAFALDDHIRLARRRAQAVDDRAVFDDAHCWWLLAEGLYPMNESFGVFLREMPDTEAKRAPRSEGAPPSMRSPCSVRGQVALAPSH